MIVVLLKVTPKKATGWLVGWLVCVSVPLLLFSWQKQAVGENQTEHGEHLAHRVKDSEVHRTSLRVIGMEFFRSLLGLLFSGLISINSRRPAPPSKVTHVFLFKEKRKQGVFFCLSHLSYWVYVMSCPVLSFCSFFLDDSPLQSAESGQGSTSDENTLEGTDCVLTSQVN